MSINAQAIADLEGEGILGDAQLLTNATVPGKDLSVLTNAASGSVDTPLTDDLKRRLLSPETIYKSVTEGVASVTDMETLQKSIAQSGAISFAKAEEVSMTFESFKSHISLKEFTRVPSKVNLAFTERYIADKIKIRQENTATALEHFLNGPTVDAEEAFNTYAEFYGKDLLEQLQEFQPKCQAWLEDKKSIPNQLMPTGRDFVNFATTAMRDLPKELTAKEKPRQLFHDAIINLITFSEGGFHTNSLIEVIQKNGSFADFIDPQRSARAAGKPLAVVEFIRFFASTYLVEFLQNVEKDAADALNTLNGIKDSVTITPADFHAVRDFVVANGQEIEQANRQIHHYIELVEILRQLYPNTSVVLDYFTV